MKQFEYVIQDELGVHARPAGLLVRKAKEFESETVITKGDKSANAKKLIALMGLAIKQGDRITVKISGEDEDKAAAEMEQYLLEIL
ncbi:MAG: HPr family phosphocarrier protein [Clostridia bacterium]|nr:HPr family phosphocarrier protein [Clostridia bacterium]MBR2878445.1 HPr family phosphocarrier protein [Clostridia bacterium]